MDTIILKGLEFRAYHGVLAEEKVKPQLFKIDIIMAVDLSLASETDDIADTINYVDVYLDVKDIVENNNFNLIEKLAGYIADYILAKYPILNVKVVVYKPNAPVKGDFDYFAVEIFRKK